MHPFVQRVVKLLQLLPQERITFSFKYLLNLALGERHFSLNELCVLLSAVVTLFIKVFCVDDQLFECVQYLNSLFVDFRIYNILQQNQFVKGHPEIVPGQHHSGLPLNFSGSCWIFLFYLVLVNVEVAVVNFDDLLLTTNLRFLMLYFLEFLAFFCFVCCGLLRRWGVKWIVKHARSLSLLRLRLKIFFFISCYFRTLICLLL